MAKREEKERTGWWDSKGKGGDMKKGKKRGSKKWSMENIDDDVFEYDLADRGKNW